MSKTIVPVDGNIKGDITDCKIETVKKSVERRGSLSATQKENYVTYDVCTKNIVTEYQTSTITSFGFLYVVIGVVAVFIVLGLIWTLLFDY
jgi:hypothetical protein